MKYIVKCIRSFILFAIIGFGSIISLYADDVNFYEIQPGIGLEIELKKSYVFKVPRKTFGKNTPVIWGAKKNSDGYGKKILVGKNVYELATGNEKNNKAYQYALHVELDQCKDNQKHCVPEIVTSPIPANKTELLKSRHDAIECLVKAFSLPFKEMYNSYTDECKKRETYKVKKIKYPNCISLECVLRVYHSLLEKTIENKTFRNYWKLEKISDRVYVSIARTQQIGVENIKEFKYSVQVNYGFPVSSAGSPEWRGILQTAAKGPFKTVVDTADGAWKKAGEKSNLCLECLKEKMENHNLDKTSTDLGKFNDELGGLLNIIYYNALNDCVVSKDCHPQMIKTSLPYTARAIFQKHFNKDYNKVQDIFKGIYNKDCKAPCTQCDPSNKSWRTKSEWTNEQMLQYFNWIFSFEYDEPKNYNLPYVAGIPVKRTLNPFYYKGKTHLVIESRYNECELNGNFWPGRYKSNNICEGLEKLCKLQNLDNCGNCN